ncbi:polyprenyl synthetase [Streptomyces sp. NPDC052496]|uniref:polyprenyl synthetase n=1 Tax=Streptomyces sp. NPDC052496 TaxID=3154951 RepID=UPI00341C86A4
MSEQGQPSDTAPTATTGWHPAAGLEQVLLLAAGAADLVLDQVRQAADRGQGLLRRSDLRDLLADGVNELRARGELASRRVTPETENYLELMARRAVRRAGASHG